MPYNGEYRILTHAPNPTRQFNARIQLEVMRLVYYTRIGILYVPLFLICLLFVSCGQPSEESSSAQISSSSIISTPLSNQSDRMLPSMSEDLFEPPQEISHPVDEAITTEIFDLTTALGCEFQEVPQLDGQGFTVYESGDTGWIIYTNDNGLEIMVDSKINSICAIYYKKAYDDAGGIDAFWSINGIRPSDTVEMVQATLGLSLSEHIIERMEIYPGESEAYEIMIDDYSIQFDFGEDGMISGIFVNPAHLAQTQVDILE